VLEKIKKGTKVLKEIFGETIFNYSKPISLIEIFTEQFCKSDGIVLDSFAGSGTTAQAILNQNVIDKGNRKFILIELEEYAEEITAKRVKGVITGYGKGKNSVKGTGGSFDYYELGKPLFLENEMLNEEVGAEKIREYVWYSETRQSYKKNGSNEEFLLGVNNNTAYYFFYIKDQLTTLDNAFLRTLKTQSRTIHYLRRQLCIGCKPYAEIPHSV
jgi:adenine-specific DNA-methyltransferase